MFKIFVFILGTIVGSFLNVCIYRIPLGKSVVYPTPCPRCGEKLKSLDLVPVLNYLWLQGRCRECQGKMSVRYPVVELLTGATFILAFMKFEVTTDLLYSMTLIPCLILSTFIDLEYGIIPDKVVIPTLILGIIFNIIVLPINFLDHILGFIMGGGLPLLIAIFFRGGIGGGDIKLLAVVGWFLGLKLTCLSLLLSFLSAGFVGLMLMVLKIKGIKDTIPFGPFIALGSFISLLVGEEIIAWYLGLFF